MQSIMTIQIPHPPTCDAIHTHTRQSLNHLKKKKNIYHYQITRLHHIIIHHFWESLVTFFFKSTEEQKKKKFVFPLAGKKKRVHTHTPSHTAELKKWENKIKLH